jgi:hypothetical protein
MISRARSFVVIAFALNLLLVSNHAVTGQASAQQGKLRDIERILGPQIGSHCCVFAIADNYLAKVEFDKEGCIKDLFVFHKLYLNRCDPDWEPPGQALGLTAEEYREILSRIGAVQKLGALTESIDVGLITNQKSDVIEQYQKAFVERRVFKITDQGDYFTQSFHVYFIHGIEGSLDNKQNTDQFGLGKLFKLKIEGDWYYTTKEEFDKAFVRTHVSLSGAGPINAGFEQCP